MSTRFEVAPMYASATWCVEGVSEESRSITALITRIASQQRILASFRWRDSLLDELSQISQNCETQGWDGYDGEPISTESTIRAAQLVELLPNGIQTPTVVPDPGGDISFEWDGGNRKNFTLGVSGQNLVYAGIFGGSSKTYGEERFSRVLPPAVVEILTSYFPQV